MSQPGWVWQIGFDNSRTDVWVIALTMDDALNRIAALKRDRSTVVFVQRKNEVTMP